MLRSLRIAMVLGLWSIGTVAAQVRSDREVLIALSDSLAGSLLSEVRNAPSLTVRFVSDTLTDAYRPLLLQGLSARHSSLSIVAVVPEMEISILRSSVRYDAPFTPSMFGPSYCLRTIALTSQFVQSEPSGGKIISARTISVSNTDTVRYADVDRLKDPFLPKTEYTAPTATFLETLVEPVIITIASGVIIYLFFTIRS